MAVSLSSQKPNPAVHSQIQHSTTPSSYSTPRRFNVSAVEDGTSQEILPGMSKSQMTLAPLLLLPTNFEHVSHDGMGMHGITPSPLSRDIPDLPSWTPLRTSKPEADEHSSASEVDEPSAVVSESKSTRAKTGSKRPGSSGLELPVNSTSLPNHPTGGNKKKARFAGVVIVSKRQRPTQSGALKSRLSPASRREAASESNSLSLVDALKRTFDANKHVEASPPSSLPHRPGRLQVRTAQEQDNDASTTPAPQIDVEAGSTEPEDERLQLNNRLLAPRSPKKHLTRAARAIALSESNNDSEDAASVSRDASVRPSERPAKRLKSIPYDAYAAFIDATLGTVQAPISWDTEQDLFTKDAPIIKQPQLPERTSADVAMGVDGETRGVNPLGQGSVAPRGRACVAENPWRTPALRIPQKAVLLPYLPRGDKFKERLVTMFGEDATVRTDRAARPKSTAFDLFASLDEPNRVPSPNPSESSASEGSPSPAEERVSIIPSTQPTSQSPELPPTSSSTSHGTSENHQLNEDGLATGEETFETREEQISGWIAALQRLVKGKVRVHDEDLEMLSVILAEIESVRDSLGARDPMTMELHESLKQLSELQEIPFGDRNNLRRRAGRTLLGWPSSA